MAVNIFLASYSWVRTRNTFGVRHHVAELYEEVFRRHRVQYYPGSPEKGLLIEGLKHFSAVLAGELNIIAPGYPVVAGALATLFRKDPRLIVHTWKVPGRSDARLSARAYDMLLRRVIDHARVVVVASHVQRRQIEALGVTCPVVFAPVTVDSKFWDPAHADVKESLAKFGLKPGSYVLTVGGNDRDERYGVDVARALGIGYVRATNDLRLARVMQEELSQQPIMADSQVLVNPSDADLRALYAGARFVCLRTVTRTNPAGLSALVEAMACGGLVGVPDSLAEGYIRDGENGLTLPETPEECAEKLELLNEEGTMAIRRQARDFAVQNLVANKVAVSVRNAVFSLSQ